MPAGSYTFQVGTLNCTVFTDGYFSYPASWLFPDADSSELARRLPPEILSPYTCLLIEHGRHVVLVDTGAGAASRTTGAMVARLEMAGLRPKDVDTVVLTHAHPDHIGGAVDARGRPAFPNARYLISEFEIEFWSNPRLDLSGMLVPEDVRHELAFSARRSLAALRTHLDPVEHELEVIPGVRAIPSPGHTPGHLAVLLSSQGQSLLNVGDAAVSPLHLQRPAWRNGFDWDAACAIRTRRSLVEHANQGKMHLMAFHFPFPSIGRITPVNGGWEWSPGWMADELL